MDPSSVLSAVKSLRAEGSSDAALLEALSRRFLASAEEFFPPQIDELLTEFAALAYCDEALLQGFSGRLADVVADASPRRVIRLLRNGAVLRLPPGAWLDEVSNQLYRHIPNLREGLPSALASLRYLGVRDKELAELLLTQGLLNSSELGAVFFSQLFEKWSLHSLPHSKVLEQAVVAATDHNESNDLRDGLNLLAGLWRCGSPEAASALEERLATRLKTARDVEAVRALTWMQRLSLRSPRLWEVCAEAVELALKNPAFVRQHLPDALHSLAVLSPGKGAEPQKADQESGREVELVAQLLGREEVSATLPRYDALQALQLFRAASLLTISCEGNSALEGRLAETIPWSALSTLVARLSRQLSLPERRQLVAAARQAEDFCKRHGVSLGSQLTLQLSSRQLNVVALPPLPPFIEQDAASKATASSPVSASLGPGTFEALWSQDHPAEQAWRGVRYLGARDIFAQSTKATYITPACSLVARALELDGWHVTLHA